MTKLKKSNYDKIIEEKNTKITKLKKKPKLWQNEKPLFFFKLKNSNCDKTRIVTILKNSNCDKTQNLELCPNSRQKKSNCDKTQKLKL